MSPKSPDDKPMTWREMLIRDIAETKSEVRLGNGKIDAMDLRINGRLKRLEKVVFGDEENKVIGLTEQMRTESREVKDLNKKWAILIAVIVFFAQSAANYIGKKIGSGTEWPLQELHEQVKEAASTYK